MSIEVSSPAFSNGQSIPVRFTCDGANVSPPLSWSGIPSNTRALALLMNDPDAPRGTFTHWVLFNLRPDADGLPEKLPPGQELESGPRQGTNGFGSNGYGGPCPPRGHGSHRYFFRVYALDEELTLNSDASGEDLIDAMHGHILDEGDLMGTYERTH